jgi:tetratricopeptide (TPR) repeat protein
MKRTNRTSILVPTLLLVSAGAVFASGSSSLPTLHQARLTPEQEAKELYNDGIWYRDKAEELEKESIAQADAGKRAKLEAKAKDKHESSIKRFVAATKKDPGLVQAWGSLGYAYRKTGRYDAALGAYATALELQPTYTPAIEYRGEAFLGLDRLDEVRTAYMTLFDHDRPRANELFAASEKWLEKKRTEPGGVDQAKLAEFAKWVAERKQLASQTPMTGGRADGRW